MKKMIKIAVVMICCFCGVCSGFQVANAQTQDEVYIGGITVGIELNSDGIVVSKMEETNKKHKENGEAEISYFEDGDLIQKVNKTKIKDLESLAKAMKKAGATVEVELLRDGEKMTISASTYEYPEGKKLGITARDKIEGIGTVTYIKQDGSFAGLGHPVSIWKNRMPAPISSGDVCNSMILGVNKGVRGKAGELKGVFIKDKNLNGEIKVNNECGIFGKFQNKNWQKEASILIETASKEEVEIGYAQIYSTINGNTPKYYDCEVVSKDCAKTKSEKGMVIKITDPELLEITGGIVQGMSGSPIVQNGKLIGAVTHVFVADPTRGYGIFIENMLSSAA